MDEIIANGGIEPDAPWEPMVVRVVEYTDVGGKRVWGVAYRGRDGKIIEDESRYDLETQFIRDPKMIWSKDDARVREVPPMEEKMGTSHQGVIRCSYDDLVAAFGPPDECGDGYKVDAEWRVRLPNGGIATVYNYKDGKNYRGELGLAVEEIQWWQVGGFNDGVVRHVERMMLGA